MVSKHQISDDFEIDYENISIKDARNIKLRFILYLEKLEELLEASFQEEKTQQIKPFLSFIKKEINNFSSDSIKLDKIEIAKVLTDIDYINIGSSILLDIPLNDCFEIIHRNNLEKEDSFNKKPITRADGKILYDSNHTPPNLESVLLKD